MSPRKPAAPKPPKAWQRDAAGTYHSADDRFHLEGDGGGRWFVSDDETADELGLARMTGPFGTLADAKTAADAQRAAGSAPSPLAERLERTRTADAGSGTTPLPSPEPLPVPQPTWLDELADHDPAAAREARALVAALEVRGIPDADALVRRDRLGGNPVVAERLLENAIRERVTEALVSVPGSPGDRVATASRVIAAVLAAVDAGGGERALPGWRLVEEGSVRRLRPDPGDL